MKKLRAGATLFFVTAGVGLLIVGCGSSGGANATYSCNSASYDSLCYQFDGPSATAKAQANAVCGILGNGSTVSANACTTTNRVGHCTLHASGTTETLAYYSTGGNSYDNTSAQNDCDNSQQGTYTSGS